MTCGQKIQIRISVFFSHMIYSTEYKVCVLDLSNPPEIYNIGVLTGLCHCVTHVILTNTIDYNLLFI